MRSYERLIAVLTLLSLMSVTKLASAKSPTASLLNKTTALKEEDLLASLGRSIGQPGFNLLADLNGDGVVNVLDAALLRLREGQNLKSAAGHTVEVAGAEQILVEPARVKTFAGNQVTVLILLRNNTTPLLGYTLDVTATASAETIGTLVPNVSATNFFDTRNVITAGGATRDPIFSVIESDGSSVISITTLTDDLSTVLAVDGVNDVFAEVVFDVSPDAEGEFLLTLGAASAISDGNGVAIPFTFIPGTVRVFDPAKIPTVSEWGIIVMSVLLIATGWIVLARNDRAIALAGGRCSTENSGDTLPKK